MEVVIDHASILLLTVTLPPSAIVGRSVRDLPMIRDPAECSAPSGLACKHYVPLSCS